MKEGVEFNRRRRWGLCHHSCCGSREEEYFLPISMDHKKSVIDGSLTQGRIGPRLRRCPAALGTYCELQEQPREWRVEAKKETQRQCLFQSGERHPKPKQRRRGSSSRRVAQSHSVNTPPPNCQPLPSLKTSFPPIPSLSSFSSSYFPTKVGGSSFRTNNKSRLASTYRRRRGTLLGVCTHNFC